MAVRPNLAWSGRATPSSTLACRALAQAAFPMRATVPRLSYNTAAVVLAATNSFVWNRRFTFRVRGPLLAGEVARFAVVAAATAGLKVGRGRRMHRLSHRGERPHQYVS